MTRMPEQDITTDRRRSRWTRRAPLAAFLLLTGACGGSSAVPLPDPIVTPPSPPLPLNQVFVLESWGAPAEDTVATFAAGAPRVIRILRGAPDNSLFAMVTFPEGSLVPREGTDSVQVRIRIPPGLYGLDISTDAEIRNGASVTFSYGMHFVSPDGARRAYGTDIRFEQFLGIGRLEADSMLVFMQSWRPASDMLRAPLGGTGRYLVAAPQSSPTFRAIVW
jgi:hypothetical protein